jgi:hypothetical protein
MIRRHLFLLLVAWRLVYHNPGWAPSLNHFLPRKWKLRVYTDLELNGFLILRRMMERMQEEFERADWIAGQLHRVGQLSYRIPLQYRSS